MNKLSLVLNVVFAAAIVVLFVMLAGVKKQISTASVSGEGTSVVGGVMPVAYVNIDSLLLNYQFSIDANEELIKKEEDVRLQINTKANRLQSEAAEFQRKLENNAFLSLDRAEQARNTILKKEQDLQALQAKLSQELMAEQQKVSVQLRDSINMYLKQLNAERKYHLILSNTASDNILIADQDSYDITSEVIEQLNIRYVK